MSPKQSRPLTVHALAMAIASVMPGLFTTTELRTELLPRLPGITHKQVSDICCKATRRGILRRVWFRTYEWLPPGLRLITDKRRRRINLHTRILGAYRALRKPASNPEIIDWLATTYPSESARYQPKKVDKAIWRLREECRAIRQVDIGHPLPHVKHHTLA